MLLFVESSEYRDFWMLLEVAQGTTFKKLDTFLRYIWLECCGHMSAFEGAGMSRKVEEIFSDEGVSLGYEYDFGTTTYLTLTSFGTITMLSSSKGIILSARNTLPAVAKCAKCGAQAEYMCTECMYDEDDISPFYCEKHLGDCDHDEDMALPVVNSPRAGECGYEGNDMGLLELFPKKQYCPKP